MPLNHIHKQNQKCETTLCHSFTKKKNNNKQPPTNLRLLLIQNKYFLDQLTGCIHARNWKNKFLISAEYCEMGRTTTIIVLLHINLCYHIENITCYRVQKNYIIAILGVSRAFKFKLIDCDRIYFGRVK